MTGNKDTGSWVLDKLSITFVISVSPFSSLWADHVVMAKPMTYTTPYMQAIQSALHSSSSSLQSTIDLFKHPLYKKAHPTPEHLLPLVVAAAAAEGESVEDIFVGIHGGLSKEKDAGLGWGMWKWHWVVSCILYQISHGDHPRFAGADLRSFEPGLGTCTPAGLASRCNGIIDKWQNAEGMVDSTFSSLFNQLTSYPTHPTPLAWMHLSSLLLLLSHRHYTNTNNHPPVSHPQHIT
jgi:hypothetical protein